MTSDNSPCPAPARILERAVHSKLASASFEAADDRRREDMDTSADTVDEGPKPKRTLPLLHRLAVHEASHAVLRLYLGLGTITKITIDAPQGGYVMFRTDEFRDHTEEYLTAHLTAMLAGRAGEEEFTNTVGANGDGVSDGSDHALATKLAYDMETTMGFGQKRPLLYRRFQDWPLHLAIDQELSEDVTRRLDAAYGAARSMVRSQAPSIDFLYRQLLQHGTLEGKVLEEATAATIGLIQQ